MTCFTDPQHRHAVRALTETLAPAGSADAPTYLGVEKFDKGTTTLADHVFMVLMTEGAFVVGVLSRVADFARHASLHHQGERLIDRAAADPRGAGNAQGRRYFLGGEVVFARKDVLADDAPRLGDAVLLLEQVLLK